MRDRCIQSRISLVTVLLAAVFLWMGMNGLVLARDVPLPGSQTVVHVVLVWLKEPGNDDHAAEIIRATHGLGNIPGVRAVKAGRVMKSKRPIVDDSYDVGLYLEFDNLEDMEAYLVHPIHQEAVREVFKPLAARYLAYDFLHEV